VEYGQDTYLSTTSDFNSEDQKTEYSYSVYAGQGQTFSESYAMTYDALKRISEIEYGSSSETLTFNYDANVGKLTSIDDSEENDSFDYAYDAKERLSSVTLPNSQGIISYTYDDTSSGKGRLDYITYPNDRSIDLSWDVRGRVTQLVMDDDGSVTTYYLSYNDAGQVKQILKSEGGITVNSWNYVYGLYGVEKATVKDASNITILTQDYTTDPFGKILSMTYTPTQNFGGSYTGELYFHYDNYGNTVLLTDGTGTPKASYEYDLHSGEKINEWNVLGIINPYTYGGGNQEITIPEPWTGGGIVVIGAGDLTTRDNGNTTVITGANVVIGDSTVIDFTLKCLCCPSPYKLCLFGTNPLTGNCLEDEMGIIDDSGTTPLQIKKESDCWKDFGTCLLYIGIPGGISIVLNFLAKLISKIPGIGPKITVNLGQDMVAGGNASWFLANMAILVKALASIFFKTVGIVAALYIAWQVGTCINQLILCAREAKKKK
jgi:hypothetical protein